MGLDLGCQLMRLERLLVQGDRPVGHVLTWLNGRIYNDLSHVDGSRSLYKQLRETFGYSPANATERYTPVCCDSRTAGLLNITPGAPLFRIERVARDLDDVVLEYSVTHTLDASLSLQIATSQSSMSQQWACTIEKGVNPPPVREYRLADFCQRIEARGRGEKLNRRLLARRRLTVKSMLFQGITRAALSCANRRKNMSSVACMSVKPARRSLLPSPNMS